VSHATRIWSRKNHAVPAITIIAMSNASRAGPFRPEEAVLCDDLKRWEGAAIGLASVDVLGGGAGGKAGEGDV
jgi:hypothetical protein